MAAADPNALRTLPPQDATHLPPLLLALWHDAQGDWQQAHEVAQEVNTADGAWVHAYLHRAEDDDANAEYWYRRAGRPRVTGPLAEEWRALALHLLAL